MYVKNEYDKQYKKDNYKQFKVYLKKEEKEELDDLLKEKNINEYVKEFKLKINRKNDYRK